MNATSYVQLKERKFKVCYVVVINACTLVPTVFLRYLKTKFEIPFAFSLFLRFSKTKFKLLFLFFIFLQLWKTEFQIPFSFSDDIDNWISTFISVVRLFIVSRSWCSSPCFGHFAQLRELTSALPFSVRRLGKLWLYFGVNNINQMEALDNIDKVFVRNFLQEENK